jgi:hypothetical protein
MLWKHLHARPCVVTQIPLGFPVFIPFSARLRWERREQGVKLWPGTGGWDLSCSGADSFISCSYVAMANDVSILVAAG